MTEGIDFQSTEFRALLAEEKAIASAQALIEWLMNQENLSNKELAERLGISQAAVSQLLGLSPRNLSLRRLARVMHALGDDLILTSAKREAWVHRKIRRASDWREAYAAQRYHVGNPQTYLAANDHQQSQSSSAAILRFSDWHDEAA